MSKFKLEQYLSDYNIKFKKKKNTKNTKFELKACVFDPSHRNNNACIFQYNDKGIVSYKCQHNSCSKYKWQDAKKEISGEDKLSKYWSIQGSPVNNDTTNNRDDINYITFDEILETVVEINPIIKNILYEGDQTVIHGAGGIGKSLLVLYMALHLASADEYDDSKYIWHDFKIHKSRKILFMQAENNKAIMNQRLKALCKGVDVFQKGMNNLFTVSRHSDVLLTGQSFSDAKFCQWLIDFIKKIETEQDIKIDILVIDPLISFYSGDENDATKIRAALDGITNICQQTKVTPIVVHHNNRSDNYRGSSAILDWARNMIALKGKPMPVTKNSGKMVTLPCIKVIHEKCNNHRKFESFILKIDKNANFQRIDESLPPEKYTQCQNVVKALEGLNGEATSENALVNAYKEISRYGKTACRNHVKMAVQYKFIECINQKLVGGKKSFKYKLIK